MAAGDASLGLLGAESVKTSLSRFSLVILLGLFLFHVNLGLEVSIGKLSTIKVVNGSNVILPCTFSSCKSFEGATFWWDFQRNRTSPKNTIIVIKLSGLRPSVITKEDRISFIGNIKSKNISLLLDDVDFDDTGFYTCYFQNPVEKNQWAQATLGLIVVSELLPVDNTVTIIILSVIGGVIGFLILIFIIKKLVMLIIKQVGKKKKECLVNSCANTEHGHYGSKADLKSPSKA
ncbi:sodium channel regulatory subunit beta-4-like [Hemitrygon akajei]|uniref:sodium channel regulatory subunit beta-4-like n=1 Tax=Hemitrygon akajei TaxID=2704970 RepID=UPI003BFA033C